MPVVARKAARSRSLEAARRAGPYCISRSPTRMWPRSGVSRRLMQRRRVDLPEPDGPMTATTPPRPTSSETPFNTSTRPKDFHRSAISIIARGAVIASGAKQSRADAGRAHRDCFVPALLAMTSTSIGAGELPLDALREEGQRKQHGEIKDRDHRVDFERAIGRGGEIGRAHV